MISDQPNESKTQKKVNNKRHTDLRSSRRENNKILQIQLLAFRVLWAQSGRERVVMERIVPLGDTTVGDWAEF